MTRKTRSAVTGNTERSRHGKAALLLDMDGVLYEGHRAVPGAAETLRWCQAAGIAYLFLTNTSSRPRSALVEKLAGMGIEAVAESMLTPPVAARHWLAQNVEGPVALFVPPATRAEFCGLSLADEACNGPVGAVVVGDLGAGWDFATLNRAFQLLHGSPDAQLVALGMTRYWQAPDGLRLDTGPYVKALEYATDRQAVVMGKPAAAFFQAGLALLGREARDCWMVGDDIRGDIGGAQDAGLHGVLVRTGKFRPLDLQGDIIPDAVLDSVADLPAWWRAGQSGASH